jgi:Uma2 family endonuclease
MEAILEPLIRSPKFLGYLDELNELGRKEAQAREQFRRSMDEDVRAEFINGEVVIQMTARNNHTMAVKYLLRLLSIFVETRGLGTVNSEQSMTGFTRNDYLPDICFWNSSKAAIIEGQTTLYPVPDFIVEVLSSSTESRDRGVKFEDYASHGVNEYWIVDPEDRVIEQYLLRDGRYELAGKFSDGVIVCVAISGLSFPVIAAFDQDANLAAVRQMLA